MFDRRKILQLAAGLPAVVAPATRVSSREGASAPNFIHICADDMRFDDDRYMPHLKQTLRDRAVVFDRHFVPRPGCAPSRAGILTGLQPHNHGVLGNRRKVGGYKVYKTLEDNALPVWLDASGYYVGHVGKFINGYAHYAPDHTPPGYSDWRVIADQGESYTDFKLDENGTMVSYGDGAYITDVLVQKALRFLATAPRPFALFFWPNCPHAPAIPDARDAGTFDNVDMPLRPAFNEADVSDKPRQIRRLPLLTPEEIAGIQDYWRRRQETLQSLDRGIGRLMRELELRGLDGNTHVIFTSDNGYLAGEHRVPKGKGLLYEEAVRVPLYWRGPGVSGGSAFHGPVSNIDVTAAMVELAGATAGRILDGRSIAPLLKDPDAPWNSATLTGCTSANGVITRDYRYMEWSGDGDLELYDMTADPFQLNNVANTGPYAEIQSALAGALRMLEGCAGPTCSWTGKFPPPPG